jgi:hypothetical protein
MVLAVRRTSEMTIKRLGMKQWKMFKSLRRWREKRACRRCKLRAVCLSRASIEMSRALRRGGKHKPAMPCAVLRQYDETYWKRMTETTENMTT